MSDDTLPVSSNPAKLNSCEAFEAAWDLGQQPRIEDHLPQAGGDLTNFQFRELLHREIKLRRMHGEMPAPSDYEQRFPDFISSIAEVFEQTFAALIDGSPYSTRSNEVGSAAPPMKQTANAAGLHLTLLSAPDQVLEPPATIDYDPYATVEPPSDQSGQPSSSHRRERAQRFGDYELLGLIARGGMGVVYKARQVKLDRLVALKMILLGDAATPEVLKRFQGEAEAAAQLDHPGIVPIYDVGDVNGKQYFSMALVEGGSLNERLKSGPLEVREAASLVKAASEAVAYAHGRGIVHRDLKPANILLTSDGQPKITDFGLAKRLELQDGLTASGDVMGTPQYMPPEQAIGNMDQVGPLADVYSLGAVLYHLLTGRPPFQAANPVETLRQVIDAEPVSPRQLNPAVDQDLDTLTLKCLDKDPRRRYSSALALAEELGRFLSGEPILARRTPAWERAWKWSKRRPALAALAVSMVLLLVSAALGGLLYAEAANQRFVLAEKELHEREALDAQRRASQSLLARGTQLLEKGDLQEAQVVIEKSLATIGETPKLVEEHAEAARLKTQLDSALAMAAERTEARERLREFASHREKALFYGSQFFGLDPRKNQELAVSEARAALALWALDREGTTQPTISPTLYSTEEQQRLRIECYELLLVLADSLAQSAPAETIVQNLLEAVQVVERAVGVHGRLTKAACLQRAAYWQQLGDPRAAAERTKADDPSVRPDTAADHFLIGKLLLRTGATASPDLTQARVSFEQALELDPDNFWAQYCLGMYHLRMRANSLANVHLTSCIARRSDFAWTYILRGSARSELEEFKLAEADFRRVVELAPDDEAKYVNLVNWGALEFKRERYDEAERLLREAIALRSDAYQAYLSLSKVCQNSHKVDDALTALHAALALESQSPIVYRERARLLLAKGDLEAAVIDLLAAIERSSDNTLEEADDLTKLGEIRFRQQRYADALAALDEAVKIAPEYPPAHLWRGAILVEENRYAEALSSFNTYAARTPKPALEFYLTRGICQASLGNYAGAIDDYTRAIERQPSAETYCKRGWLYALRGNPLFGQQDFDRAVELDSNSADSHCGRGLVLARLGKHAEAVVEAETALRLDSTTSRSVYKIATIYAVAAPRVQPTKDKTGPSAADLRVRYLKRAAELLDQSLSLEPAAGRALFWRSIVEVDAQFAPLLGTPEFQRIRAKWKLSDSQPVSKVGTRG